MDEKTHPPIGVDIKKPSHLEGCRRMLKKKLSIEN
jgi:hypothetical protein